MTIVSTRLTARKCMEALAGIQYGVIHLIAPDNRIITVGGAHDGPEVTWTLHDWSVLSRFFTCGEGALGEDYMAGKWEVDNVNALKTFFQLNCKLLRQYSCHTTLGCFFSSLMARLSHWKRLPEDDALDLSHLYPRHGASLSLGEPSVYMGEHPAMRSEDKSTAIIFELSEFRNRQARKYTQPHSGDT